MTPDLTDIKALTFDVFGTCVDFRASIIKDCRAWGKAKHLFYFYFNSESIFCHNKVGRTL